MSKNFIFRGKVLPNKNDFVLRETQTRDHFVKNKKILTTPL